MSLDFYLEMSLDTGGDEHYQVLLFDGNITHNLNTMASEAGLYKCLWRPDENYGSNPLAEEIIESLEKGLVKLKSDSDYYKKFNPKNGWGNYKGLISFTENVLEACQKHPKANIKIWR